MAPNRVEYRLEVGLGAIPQRPLSPSVQAVTLGVWSGEESPMIPYAASEEDEPLQIVPWTNYGLIAANFLVFFDELAVGAQGTGLLNRFINGFSLVPCEYTQHCTLYPGTP